MGCDVVVVGGDRWATQAGDHADVLDDFRLLENDLDFVEPLHGSDGLIPIRLHPPSELNRGQSAFIDGAVASGHMYVDDQLRVRFGGRKLR